MIITFIGITIVLGLLILLSILNYIVGIFNGLLYNTLKLLVPIGITTVMLYLFFHNILNEPPSTDLLDTLTGFISLIYCYVLVKQQGRSKRSKLLITVLFFPIVYYLLNTHIEYLFQLLFSVSPNQLVMNYISNNFYPDFGSIARSVLTDSITTSDLFNLHSKIFDVWNNIDFEKIYNLLFNISSKLISKLFEFISFSESAKVI